MEKWNQCSRWLGAVVTAVLIISMMTPAWNVLGAYIAVGPELQSSDAIVVLGAGLMKDGTLSDESMRRAVTGISLYKRGLAPRIVFSGPASDNGLIESAVRADLAIEMGIPRGDILQVSEVSTTRDEAARVSDLLGRNRSTKILLVTEALHLRRARMVFERAGLRVFAAPADNEPYGASKPEGRLGLMRSVLREAGALIYYRLAGYI